MHPDRRTIIKTTVLGIDKNGKSFDSHELFAETKYFYLCSLSDADSGFSLPDSTSSIVTGLSSLFLDMGMATPPLKPTPNEARIISADRHSSLKAFFKCCM